MKKAQDFLVDSSLGDKAFAMEQAPAEEKIVLSIDEGAVPVSLLKDAAKPQRGKAPTKNIFARIDDALRAFGQPDPKDKATFFRLLSIMIDAGVPLIKSLDTIGEQTLNARLKSAIFDIARSIEKGGTFSDSLSGFTTLFSAAHIGMIHAAEISGQLNQILKQLAIEVEKSASIKRKVKGALMYPVFIMSVMVLVVSAMMIMVVPKIADIFKDSGKELPVITRFVIGTSDIFAQHWLLLLVGLVAFIVGFSLFSRTPFGKGILDSIIIRLPIFGALVRQGILARFCRSLGNLLKSGVPITQTLIINSQSVGNEVYKKRLELAADDLSSGIPLAESLRDSPEFPSMMVQMISVGEQTAQLDSIVGKIAEYYEEEIDVTVASLSKLLEPMLLVVLGVVVGGIVAAIMLPIIQLTTIAG